MNGGPCSWDIIYSGCYTCESLSELDDVDRARIEQMATSYLWNWTGKQFGTCTTSIRPDALTCRYSTFVGGGPYTQTASPSTAAAYRSPSIYPAPPSQWITCTSTSPSCGCPAAATTLQLPGPVAQVVEVLVDNVPVDPATYRLDTPDLLVALADPWPTHQPLNAPLTQAGTWEVTYLRGVPVPEGGQIAAGALACELAKAWCQDTSCALPQRIQTVTRQGVTLAMVDPFTGLEKGHTGIWLIDSWVTSINEPRRSATVRSVDIPYGQRIGRFTHGL